MSERCASYEHDDKHQANEKAFLEGIAGMADQLMAGFEGLVLVAEPRALGVLRDVLSSVVLSKTTTQIDKDYTKTPIPELEALLRQG